MSRTFAGLSGTYDVRANEQSRGHHRGQQMKNIRCLVLFLDDSQHVFEVEKRAKGEQLLEMVFRHLELIERDYFGLEFLDKDARRWLDASKSIFKQLKPPYLFHFKVKFYVDEPSKLLEEYTRYHFFLQLRRDILNNKLQAPHQSLVLLSSFVAQSELGDYSPDEHSEGYLSSLKFVANQNAQFEAQVVALHKHHKGQTPADAELNYLEVAKTLDLYGVELHPAIDCHGHEIQIGVSGAGLSVFEHGSKLNTFSWGKIIKISFKRRHFFIQLRREGTEQCDNLLGFTLSSYRACKSLWKSCVEQHTFFRLETPKPHTKKFFFFLSLGSRFRYSGKTQFQTLQENKKRLIRTQRTFVRTRSSRFTRQTVPIPSHIQNLMLSSHHSNGTNKPAPAMAATAAAVAAAAVVRHDSHNKVVSVSESPARKMRHAWSDSSPPFCPNSIVPYIDAPPSPTSPVHLVTITLRPDDDGKFGFNVKGGSDQQCPILVSRVAPNTAADQSVPRLREGDQVLAINGQDCDGKTHQEIVDSIRSCRGKDASLQLTVRPNVAISPTIPEPDFQYIPLESPDQLRESMAQLHESLENGSLVTAFESLNRGKPGETMKAARSLENVHKNRYRDISPYDSTRVVLMDSLTGDYINASFVNMNVGESQLKYIATQGPLPETTDDFWAMVWQERCFLVVMVTPLEEKGRQKCHKYWPDKEQQYGQVKVVPISDKEVDGIVERQFDVSDRHSCSTLRVTQLQYLLWPDHGVPQEYEDFNTLINKVRSIRRSGGEAPIIVHCSAGIGRTGVLILMETALCLIECRQPVRPLDLVDEMRQHRAMLIQTSSQFKFVCEALWRVWSENTSSNNSCSNNSSGVGNANGN